MFKSKLSRKQIQYFAVRMSSYMARGYKIQKALEVLSTNTNRQISKTAKEVMGYLVAGIKPDIAFERSEMFPNEFVAVVRSSLHTPDNGKLFLALSETIGHSVKVRKDVWSIMKVPIIYTIMLILVSIVMLYTVIPSFIHKIEDAEGMAYFLMTTQLLLKGIPYYIWIVIVAAIGGIGYSVFMIRGIRIQVEMAIIQIPIIGRLILEMDIARATAYLGLLLNTDKSGSQPFRMAADAVSLLILKDALLKWAELSMTMDMIRSFELSSNVWPKDLHDAVEAGYRTSSLPEEIINYSSLLREDIGATIEIIKPTVEFLSIMLASMGIMVVFMDCFITPMSNQMSGL